MAVGDRVRIDTGTVLFKTQGNNIVVYHVVLGPDNTPLLDKNGCARLTRAGGVKSGTLGYIAGPSVRVFRSELIEAATTDTMAAIGNDFVDVFPIMLDHYQQIGWFPIDHIKQF